MKFIKLLFSKVVLAFLLNFTFAYANSNVEFFPETDFQLNLYEQALQNAEDTQRPIVFVLGFKGCPWCSSLANLFSKTDLGVDIAKYAWIQPLNLMGDVQEVIDRLKSKSGMNEKISGYPFIFVVDIKRDLTTPISLADMEHNIPEQGLYTHFPDQIKAAVYSALGVNIGQNPIEYIYKSGVSVCQDHLKQ